MLYSGLQISFLAWAGPQKRLQGWQNSVFGGQIRQGCTSSSLASQGYRFGSTDGRATSQAFCSKAARLFPGALARFPGQGVLGYHSAVSRAVNYLPCLGRATEQASKLARLVG